jgi:hypothetical protein
MAGYAGCCPAFGWLAIHSEARMAKSPSLMGCRNMTVDNMGPSLTFHRQMLALMAAR